MGESINHDGSDGDQGCFKESDTQGQGVTTASCFKKGHFLQTGKPVTFIDTPGFGVTKFDDEYKDIEGLVKLLRDEIKFVHVFVLAIIVGTDRFKKGTVYIRTVSSYSMLSTLLAFSRIHLL